MPIERSKLTATVFNDNAALYAEKYMDMGLYKPSLDAFCTLLKKQHATILELGCGPGNVAKYILDQQPHYNLTGIDVAENMITLAQIHNPKATFNVMDCRDINTLKTTYDAIVCGFCLPYLSKEEVKQLIKNVSEILNPEGLFYISTMEDDYEKSALKPSSNNKDNVLFIYYHESKYLIHWLEEAGFKILYKEQKVHPEHTSKNDLMIIAKLK